MDVNQYFPKHVELENVKNIKLKDANFKLTCKSANFIYVKLNGFTIVLVIKSDLYNKIIP